MKNKAFLLLLIAGFSTFLNSSSFATDYYGSTSSSSRMTVVRKGDQSLDSKALFNKFAFSPSELIQLSSSLSYAELIAAGQTIPNYTVALAALNQNEDFFGYNPRDPKETAQFNADMQALTQQRYADHPLVCNWIEQPSSVMKLIGFLNSFGMTLANVDLEKVASVVKAQEEIDPKKCLNKAYGDMTRLISGQVVKINPARTVTQEEEKIYVTAASNLGWKKALEFKYLTDNEKLKEKVICGLLEDYNLLDHSNLDEITLRHNLILLGISYSEAFFGKYKLSQFENLKATLFNKGLKKDLLDEIEQRVSLLLNKYHSIKVARMELKTILYGPASPFNSSQNSSHSTLGGSVLDDWVEGIDWEEYSKEETNTNIPVTSVQSAEDQSENSLRRVYHSAFSSSSATSRFFEPFHDQSTASNSHSTLDNSLSKFNDNSNLSSSSSSTSSSFHLRRVRNPNPEKISRTRIQRRAGNLSRLSYLRTTVPNITQNSSSASDKSSDRESDKSDTSLTDNSNYDWS